MTIGETVAEVECYCLGNNKYNKPCLPCRIDEAIVKTQTAFKKHIEECSAGFYGRWAAKKAAENEELKRQIAELKKQVCDQWV